MRRFFIFIHVADETNIETRLSEKEKREFRNEEIPQSGITVCRRADNSGITIVFYPWICFTIIVPRINPGSRCLEMEKNGEAFARRTRLDAATAKKRNGGALNQKRIRTLRTSRDAHITVIVRVMRPMRAQKTAP